MFITVSILIGQEPLFQSEGVQLKRKCQLQKRRGHMHHLVLMVGLYLIELYMILLGIACRWFGVIKRLVCDMYCMDFVGALFMLCAVFTAMLMPFVG
jgi:hypothetical protein